MRREFATSGFVWYIVISEPWMCTRCFFHHSWVVLSTCCHIKELWFDVFQRNAVTIICLCLNCPFVLKCRFQFNQTLVAWTFPHSLGYKFPLSYNNSAFISNFCTLDTPDAKVKSCKEHGAKYKAIDPNSPGSDWTKLRLVWLTITGKRTIMVQWSAWTCFGLDFSGGRAGLCWGVGRW